VTGANLRTAADKVDKNWMYASIEASAAACNFSESDARELFPFNFAEI
jgi:hypothetical protein